ncbi:SIMPL domain-containing protein [Rheinheimera mesophila]|uniref:SIMPL domain-containing protein n=1 Tax=Rheinheimera mesophila TaxID=1547515 RepID=UPI001FD0A9E4|nr:SIMPL domain-containing protein [Rheinheimera mesophila]
MQQSRTWVAAAIVAAAMVAASAILANSLIAFRAMERVVQVKGLSEREVAADTVIWPIKFNEVDNNLTTLVANLERKNEQIQAFLKLQGFSQKKSLWLCHKLLIVRQVSTTRTPISYATPPALL